MNTPMRLAIVGCGFAAQEIHIPRLLKLPELFSVLAVCDREPGAAERAARKLGGARQFVDVTEMMAEVEANALVVLTPHHAALVESGLRKGCDIFVEKPFCETPQEARHLRQLAEESGRVIMVGAMRVFDPALAYLKSMLPLVSPLRWIEIRDFCGQGLASAVRESLADPFYQSVFPYPDGQPRNAIQTMLLEFIHDASILREVFGTPITCQQAEISGDGWSTTGALALSGGIPCLFAVAEFGLPKVNIFDVRLTVAGERGLIQLQFGDPNDLDGATTTITLNEQQNHLFRSDPFLDEWKEFYRAVTHRQAFRNNAADGAADLELAWDIISKGLDQ